MMMSLAGVAEKKVRVERSIDAVELGDLKGRAEAAWLDPAPAPRSERVAYNVSR